MQHDADSLSAGFIPDDWFDGSADLKMYQDSLDLDDSSGVLTLEFQWMDTSGNEHSDTLDILHYGPADSLLAVNSYLPDSMRNDSTFHTMHSLQRMAYEPDDASFAPTDWQSQTITIGSAVIVNIGSLNKPKALLGNRCVGCKRYEMKDRTSTLLSAGTSTLLSAGPSTSSVQALRHCSVQAS